MSGVFAVNGMQILVQGSVRAKDCGRWSGIVTSLVGINDWMEGNDGSSVQTIAVFRQIMGLLLLRC